MKHARQAEKFLADTARTRWHDETLWMVRQKRDTGSRSVPEWEKLRELASGIKDHLLSRLDSYLEQFEEQAKRNGIHVHWAADAEEHNRIVHGLLSLRGVTRVVKSKSILTEECHLNPYLESRGIEVVDTDLGERIVQFLRQPPSHIVMPAIHLKKREIGELFHRVLGTDAGSEDPEYLTRAARRHLREKFLNAQAAITGVNFGIAETGGFVVCTNEGNADMGVHIAPIHIASMGIEKLLPKAEHLGVFTRLLARSGTGQAVTVYTSHFHRPRPGQELHIVLVDNGRTAQLGREKFRNSLKCIRCGACMNTCPIYRRSGGFSYEATVPGPIGSILSPGTDLKKYSSLPFASTLCGSCSDVCPVKIDIHEQLYSWRQEIVEAGQASVMQQLVMWMTGRVMSSPRLFRFLSRSAAWMLGVLPDRVVRWTTWGRRRDLPVLPPASFRDWYAQNRSGR